MIKFIETLGYTPLLLLDDGHGIDTAGKRTPPLPDGSVIKENQFNAAVVKLIEEDAIRLGFKTLLLAPEDTDTPLGSRSKRANEAYKKYKTELAAKGVNTSSNHIVILVSVHYNALTGTWESKAEGVSTHCYPGSIKSKRLAECIQKNLIKGTAQKNRGVVESDFHILRETIMPAALIEAGFMDNSREAQLMLNKDFQKEVATEVLNGICEFLNVEYVPASQPMPVKTVIQRLKEMGLINQEHKPKDNLTWEEFATVILRLVDLVDK